jgi:hypothetical protein
VLIKKNRHDLQSDVDGRLGLPQADVAALKLQLAQAQVRGLVLKQGEVWDKSDGECGDIFHLKAGRADPLLMPGNGVHQRSLKHEH